MKLFKILFVTLLAGVLIGLVSWLILALHWHDWSNSLMISVLTSTVTAGLIVGVIFVIIYYMAEKAENTSHLFHRD